MTSNLIELFVLKNAAISTEMEDVLGKLNIATKKSEVEIATDRLVDDYIRQIDYTIRNNAERMSEFYKIFYMLENDIRALVESTLEDEKDQGWWDATVPQEVRDNVKKNRDREANEGLPPRSAKMIDYKTFGELGEIIKNNWDVFGGIFSGSDRNRVLRVINRLNLARGPIAHCGVLTEDEVVRLKLTVRDWYKLME
jgi:hypothetical protein